MKITIVLGAFFPVPPIMGGAVEKVMFALAQEFVQAGHEVTVISRTMPQFPREETRDGIRYVRISGFNAPRSLVWLKVLDLVYSIRTMSILSASGRTPRGEPRADIVVTNTFWLPLLLPRKKRGLIYVHVTRYPKGQMRFYRKAARLQAPSRAVANAISAEAPASKDRVKVIPNPLPRPIAVKPAPIEQREKIVLYVGRVHPEKGVHLLVDAFVAAARTLFADWKLVIVGPAEKKYGGGGDKYVVDLTRRAVSCANRVALTGPVFDAGALEQHYASARIFVYPSLADYGEAFGVAPLEAMSNGAAVIVSNLECFRDFITDSETGFIFDHRATDPAGELRKTMERLIVDPALLSRVADAGYRKSAEYSPARVAQLFLQDFESLLSNSNGAGTNC